MIPSEHKIWILLYNSEEEGSKLLQNIITNYQFTSYYIPDDRNLHQYHSEPQISYVELYFHIIIALYVQPRSLLHSDITRVLLTFKQLNYMPKPGFSTPDFSWRKGYFSVKAP
jgi:hypothetical protein